MHRSLRESGYTELIKSVSVTEEECAKWRRRLRLGTYMRGRLHELLSDMIAEQMVEEDEVWSEIGAKVGWQEGDSTAPDVHWVGREVRLWKKPDGTSDVAPAAREE